MQSATRNLSTHTGTRSLTVRIHVALSSSQTDAVTASEADRAPAASIEGIERVEAAALLAEALQLLLDEHLCQVVNGVVLQAVSSHGTAAAADV